ncbi:RNA polymerase sigma factor [Planctomycetota bacterium]
MTTLTNKLIDLYEPITRACCRRHCLSEDQVDDVVHDTFLAAYRSLSNYRNQSRMSSWLWIIAQRQIINQQRKQVKQQQEVNHLYNQQDRSLHDPLNVSQSRELREQLHARVAALPPIWKTVIRLFYWHHKNTHEIAMHLQIEPGTIRVILHRSRQRLRQELETMYAA